MKNDELRGKKQIKPMGLTYGINYSKKLVEFQDKNDKTIVGQHNSDLKFCDQNYVKMYLTIFNIII